MKCKLLKIETNGTITGTKIFADDQQIGFVQRIEFEADTDNIPRILINKVRMNKDNKPTERILKVRDEKTLKFIEKKTFETDPIVIEFEALEAK